MQANDFNTMLNIDGVQDQIESLKTGYKNLGTFFDDVKERVKEDGKLQSEYYVIK